MKEKTIKFIAFLLAFAVSLSFVFWGRGSMDPYYWLSVYAKPSSYGLSVGTWVIGHYWCESFGYTILSIRILGWICCTSAMLVPFFSLNSKEERSCPPYWWSLVIAILLMGYGTFNEFSPGTLTFLLLSVNATCFILWNRTKKKLFLYVLGVTTSLCVFCRFPNVLILFIIALFLLAYPFFDDKKEGSRLKRGVIDTLTYTLVLLCSYYLLFVLFTGSLDIFSYYADAFSLSSTGTHSVDSMFIRLFNGFNEIIIDCGLVFVLSWLSYYVNSIPRRNVKILTWFLSFVLMAYLLRQNIGTHQWYNQRLHIFTSSLSILLTLSYVRKMFDKKKSKEGLAVLFALFMLMVAPIGSDTGWLKLFPSVLIMVPILLPQCNGFWKNHVAISLAFLFCMYACVCYANNNISKGDGGNIVHMTKNIDNPVLMHLLLSSTDKTYIKSLCDVFDKYGEVDNTIFYGNAVHFASMVTGSKPVYDDYGFWMYKNDSLEISKLFNHSFNECPVVFDLEKNDCELFLEYVEQKEYQLVYEDEICRVYTKR